MHVFFSYIGGGGISPLALIAKQAGYEVSGTDKKDSSPYLKLLKSQGIANIGIGVSDEFIKQSYQKQPIDWYVYSSAVEKEYPNHPEFIFCRQNGIKMTKRDQFINEILSQKGLKMVAVAGTHGKTTTTAMLVWLFKQLGLPISYSVGAKISFGDMGQYEPDSQYFIYEADEFDRNFLAFHPYISLVTGLSWDHHEIYPTQEDYYSAFKQFVMHSKWVVMRYTDYEKLDLGFKEVEDTVYLVKEDEGTWQEVLKSVKLLGYFNRLDAILAAQVVHELTKEPMDKLLDLLSNFP